MKLATRVDFDKVGAFASAICAVHCLLTGVALGLLSVVGLGFLGSPIAELGFFIVTLVVGIVALVHGRRKHHSVVPAWIFVCGLGFILASHFVFGHGHDHPSEKTSFGGTLFSVLGGLCLVAFHVVNQRLQHRCGCVHCSHSE